ncbi:MAG: hypothetical protein RQ936_02250 [Gammaproteobacteria bacterium]|nr:hypothetical protein [Gammaproteobacteria bacterium]
MASEEAIKKVIDYLDMAESTLKPDLTTENAERGIYYFLMERLNKKSFEEPHGPHNALANELWMKLEDKSFDSEDWDEDHEELYAYRYLKNALIKNLPNEVCDLIVEVIEDETGFGECMRELEDVLQDKESRDFLMSTISKLKS